MPIDLVGYLWPLSTDQPDRGAPDLDRHVAEVPAYRRPIVLGPPVVLGWLIRAGLAVQPLRAGRGRGQPRLGESAAGSAGSGSQGGVVAPVRRAVWAAPATTQGPSR